MVKNYLIGIGGTGAKVIESVLHLCAAGFGPQSLSVFLIDPDQANMNHARTSTLLKQYRAAAAGWRDRPARAHMQPFRTDVKFAEEPIWTIFKKKDVTLSGFLNVNTLQQSNADYAQLISVLFTEKELQTPLTRGFRGHPSIGSVVMSNVETAAMKETEDMVPADGLRQLWQDIQECAEGEARVFLVGSVFGGTGAAGVPTFGSPKMLKQHESAKLENKASRILLGGALVLPYFSFEVDPDAVKKGQQDMYVTPADFPIATKAALEYYNEKDMGFDQIYFVGDSLAQRVGKFGTGGKEQDNGPHYIELVTGLAALDFWRHGAKAAGEPEYFIAARDTATVTWSGLPVTRDSAQLTELQSQLALQASTMTAFGYVLNTYGADFLGRLHKNPDNAVGWYTDHFKFDLKNKQDEAKDPRNAENRAGIDLVTAYSREFVKWLSSIGALEQVDLIDGTKLFADPVAGTFLPPLKYTGNIGAFLTGLSRNPAKATWHNYLEKLNELAITDPAMSPTDRFLNLLYEASYEFCSSGYGLSTQHSTKA